MVRYQNETSDRLPVTLMLACLCARLASFLCSFLDREIGSCRCDCDCDCGSAGRGVETRRRFSSRT